MGRMIELGILLAVGWVCLATSPPTCNSVYTYPSNQESGIPVDAVFVLDHFDYQKTAPINEDVLWVRREDGGRIECEFTILDDGIVVVDPVDSLASEQRYFLEWDHQQLPNAFNQTASISSTFFGIEQKFDTGSISFTTAENLELISHRINDDAVDVKFSQAVDLDELNFPLAYFVTKSVDDDVASLEELLIDGNEIESVEPAFSNKVLAFVLSQEQVQAYDYNREYVLYIVSDIVAIDGSVLLASSAKPIELELSYEHRIGTQYEYPPTKIIMFEDEEFLLTDHCGYQ